MRQAIGFFEIRSKVAAIQAADTMLKTADVSIKDFNLVGSGVISVIIEGDVAAVKAAIENAKATAGNMAEVISVNVIPRPNEELDKLFGE
ncbi:BMC domain-containing protein [Wukongibacter sp. M2B1]|uniref:BMC domain-containing protein n=1 Tax=Wukongibacter sp. M2B1 TaxID=3088895 RepID=UPI003D7A91A9